MWAAEGFWLPPSCLTSGKVTFLSAFRQPASQPSLLIKGSACPRAVPKGSVGLSKVTHQRNIPCITQPSLQDEVTRAQHRLRTLHRHREMSAPPKQTLLGNYLLIHLFSKTHSTQCKHLGPAGP